MAKFWSEEVTRVQKTPNRVLREASEELETATKGLLKLNLLAKNDRLAAIEIVAHKVQYVREICWMTSPEDMVFPTSLSCNEDVFVEKRGSHFIDVSEMLCNNQEEFERALQQLFASSFVKAIVASLMARSHDHE